MRKKTEYASRPVLYELDRIGNMAVIRLRENILRLEPRVEGTERWEADEYTLELSWFPGLEERIQAAVPVYLARAKQADYDFTATEIRKVRDDMLKESDKDMALDRMGLVAPKGNTFTAWLTFLRGFGDVLAGEATKYRQALRDVPQQPGFPYDVQWPNRDRDR